jgi:hypothetical protein
MKRMKRLRMKTRVTCVLTIFAMLALETTALWPVPVEAAIVLDPTNPANFSSEGLQTITPGAVLTFTDQSIGDFALLFGNDADAVPGVELDVIATFQVLAGIPANADAGNRIAINDGLNKAAIAACVIQNGVKGIGLLSQGDATDPASYPVFVPVDWQAAPVTVRLRRYANGDAELVEVNGSRRARVRCSPLTSSLARRVPVAPSSLAPRAPQPNAPSRTAPSVRSAW